MPTMSRALAPIVGIPRDLNHIRVIRYYIRDAFLIDGIGFGGVDVTWPRDKSASSCGITFSSIAHQR